MEAQAVPIGCYLLALLAKRDRIMALHGERTGPRARHVAAQIDDEIRATLDAVRRAERDGEARIR